jgi:hypothetical protein
MTGECSDLGGHGVLDATLQVTETPGDGFTAATVEFKVTGTAARVNGCPPLPRPFTTELSGPDFAKLLAGGWVAAGIALGISVAGLHDNLLSCVRQDARNRLEQTIRALGADGVVVPAMTLHVRSDQCRAHPSGTDHFAEAVITGTAVARFAGRPEGAVAPSLAVLSLDPGR